VNKKVMLIGAGVVVLILILITFPKEKNITEAAGPNEPAIRGEDLYQQALAFKNDRKILQSKNAYQRILTEFPDIENVEKIQKELEDLNLQIIKSGISSPQSATHEVKQGDTLGELAKKYGTTIELIKMSNNLKSDVIRIGQKLRVWTKKFNVFVDKSRNILILKSGDEVIKVYSVSTGENNSTPIGNFKIVAKLVDPVWFNRGVVVPPESPHNVLGSRWLGFDLPGYGIHGTIEPKTIGQQITAGCVRMRNSEVEELYSLLPMGTEITIVD